MCVCVCAHVRACVCACVCVCVCVCARACVRALGALHACVCGAALLTLLQHCYRASYSHMPATMSKVCNTVCESKLQALHSPIQESMHARMHACAGGYTLHSGCLLEFHNQTNPPHTPCISQLGTAHTLCTLLTLPSVMSNHVCSNTIC